MRTSNKAAVWSFAESAAYGESIEKRPAGKEDNQNSGESAWCGQGVDASRNRTRQDAPAISFAIPGRRRTRGSRICGPFLAIMLLPIAVECLVTSLPKPCVGADIRLSNALLKNREYTSNRLTFAGGLVLSSTAPKDGASKASRGRRSLLTIRKGNEASSDHSSEGEVLVGSWEAQGTDKAGPLQQKLVNDEWLSWLTEGFPAMLSTISGLTDRRASTRKAAVGQLLKCAADHPAGPTAPWAVAALAGRLEDDSACVREAAVRGLVKVSEKGNRQVVLAMACLIEEETAVTVKKAALQALTRLANRGDEEAVGPVIKVLQRVQGHERGDIFAPDMSRVNKHAVKALGTLAGRGDEEALKALHVRILDDSEASVREAAARSLGNLASADDARSMAALMLCMEDDDLGVRRTAIKSVKTVLRRQREGLDRGTHEGDSTGNSGCSMDESSATNADDECGASRLWLLPGVWGG